MNKFYGEITAQEGLQEADLANSGFRYIKGFGIAALPKNSTINFDTGGCETGLVVMEGSCDISIDGSSFEKVGARNSVFSGKPFGAYAPIGAKVVIKSHGAKIAVCRAACDKKTASALLRPEDIKEMTVGKKNWERHVRIIIGANSPSVNLIVGETLNPPGNWSGTPAHKHEKTNHPHESLHEELYYFKTDKPDGFGIERFYSYERGVNELIYLKENTVTFMPWGYHQIVSAPGYTLYYLFFLAGVGKDLVGSPDPRHTWINE